LLLAGRHPTGLKSGAKLADFTRAYRRGLEPDAVWPEARPDGRFGEVLARALCLRASERPRDGRALLDLFGSGPDLVLRVSNVGVEAPTAVATPRAMLDETAAVPSGRVVAPSAEATPSDEKPARDRFSWVVVGTLVLAAGVAALAVREFRGPEPTRAPSARPNATLAPPPTRALSTPLADGGDDADDGDGGDAAETDAVTIADPCAAGCSSGRGCGDTGCDAPLDPTIGYRLRLAAVFGDEHAHALYGTYATGEVCVSVAGVTRDPVCTPLADVEDGGVPHASLYVEASDLTGRGIAVTVRNVIPGAGAAELAKVPETRFDKLTRDALCHGITVDGFPEHPEWRAVFYLDDDTDAAPRRCPAVSDADVSDPPAP